MRNTAHIIQVAAMAQSVCWIEYSDVDGKVEFVIINWFQSLVCQRSFFKPTDWQACIDVRVGPSWSITSSYSPLPSAEGFAFQFWTLLDFLIFCSLSGLIKYGLFEFIILKIIFLADSKLIGSASRPWTLWVDIEHHSEPEASSEVHNRGWKRRHHQR